MNKALITKFLSNIDNNDLPIFGAIVIKSNPTSSVGTTISIENTEEFSVSELGGSDVLFNDKVVTSIPKQKGGFIVVKKNRDEVKYIVLKDIKYKPVLTGEFRLFGSATCDISYLKYQSNITTILENGDEASFTGSLSDLPSGVTKLMLHNDSLITGNIKDLPSGITNLNLHNDSLITGNIKDLPSGITNLSLNDSSSITGNIKDLPSGITDLSLVNSSSITGTLESYVEKLYNAHKNDGKDFTLSAHTELTMVTFNGASANYLSTTTISGGKATVRLGGSEQGRILGTYDGTSWTYNS